MNAMIATLQGVIALINGWELLAVVLGVAYLVLAMRESLWCWYAAFVSSALFVFVMWQAGLVMETGLQVYYVVMAVYGWWRWRGGFRPDALPARIHVWPWWNHAMAIGIVLLLSIVSGLVLSEFAVAQRPYIDAFVTWSSVLTTWMVARKLLENWIYWLVIDSISLALYLDRGLYPTALLFAAYVILVVCGFIEWWRHYREQQGSLPAQSTG
jgi:nicotinamide mononucleotide transporter